MPFIDPSIKSSPHQPLPKDWKPPEWITVPKLKPIDPKITAKIKEASNGKIFDPSLEPPLKERISPIKAACCSILGGCLAASLLNYIFDTHNNFSNFILSLSIAFCTRRYIDSINNQILDPFLAEARKNPLFEQVYQSATANGPINLNVVFKHPNPDSAHLNDAYATYGPEVGILIWANAKKPSKVFLAIIFEFVNAFQKANVNTIDDMEKKGLLDKEQYVIAMEYAESLSVRICSQILEYGVQNLNWHLDLDLFSKNYIKSIEEEASKEGKHPFVLEWELANLKDANCKISHADLLRGFWELNCNSSKSNGAKALN